MSAPGPEYCPSWCVTPTENHIWQLSEDDGPFISHDGPTFGDQLVYVGGATLIDGAVLELTADIDSMAYKRMDATEALALGQALLEAAAWLEAQQ